MLASIRAAGFDPRDVRWILASHEHDDHVGGLQALKLATGARVAARAEQAAALAAGKPGPEDPQHAIGSAPTDLSLHPNSPGYRLILNNVLFPAAKKKPRKT